MAPKDQIRLHFANLPITVKNVLDFCQAEYENLARLRGDLYVTSYLETLAKQVCKALSTSNNFREKVVRSLYPIMLSYRVRSGMECNKAPIFHPKRHFELIEHLWFKLQPSVALTFANKTAAVQAILCLHTFRRWVDISRIRWEHCQRIHNQGRLFLKFKLSASKSNFKGHRNEYVTIQQNSSRLCPVKMLNEYWKIQGCPRTGFVLPCLHKDRIFKRHSLFAEWDAYVCKGHSSNKQGKIPCLGEVNGTTSFGYYERAAKKLKWPVLPHKHSFRRLGIVIANKLDIPRDRITEFFGWKNTSEMPSHYLQEELASTSQGLAWKFSDALENNLQCLNDVSFTL